MNNPILLDGKKLSEKLFIRLKDNFGEKSKEYKLIILTVGDDPASKVYVKNKIRACNIIGIQHEHIIVDENIEQQIG